MAVKELYVGNLIYEVTLEDITALFSPYGVIHDARVVAARQPGNPHAFAFVMMEERAANEAMRALDGEEYMGLTLVIDEASGNSAAAAINQNNRG